MALLSSCNKVSVSTEGIGWEQFWSSRTLQLFASIQVSILFALYARRLSCRGTFIGWKIQILVGDTGVVEAGLIFLCDPPRRSRSRPPEVKYGVLGPPILTQYRAVEIRAFRLQVGAPAHWANVRKARGRRALLKRARQLLSASGSPRRRDEQQYLGVRTAACGCCGVAVSRRLSSRTAAHALKAVEGAAVARAARSVCASV